MTWQSPSLEQYDTRNIKNESEMRLKCDAGPTAEDTVVSLLLMGTIALSAVCF